MYQYRTGTVSKANWVNPVFINIFIDNHVVLFGMFSALIVHTVVNPSMEYYV